MATGGNDGAVQLFPAVGSLDPLSLQDVSVEWTRP